MWNINLLQYGTNCLSDIFPKQVIIKLSVAQGHECGALHEDQLMIMMVCETSLFTIATWLIFNILSLLWQKALE